MHGRLMSRSADAGMRTRLLRGVSLPKEHGGTTNTGAPLGIPKDSIAVVGKYMHTVPKYDDNMGSRIYLTFAGHNSMRHCVALYC
jgi:hypothetical protein